jgi:alpha-ketoglutarate-dependent taurine dioxygenase
MTNTTQGGRNRRSARRGISLDQNMQVIKTRPLLDDSGLFLLIEPAINGVNLHDWIKSNPEQVNQWVHKHGALLFRGFDLKQDEDFINISKAFPYESLPAELFEESTPRKVAGPGIYTTTAFPREESIALHSDYSPSMCLAIKLGFFCTLPPEQGGETPFADTRQILRHLDPQVSEKFRRLGWRLVRNYRPELGLSWESTFNGQSREQINAHCEANHIEVRWCDGIPQTIQSRAAIFQHPDTGEDAWFNHVSFWHVDNLPEAVSARMLAEVGIEGLPFNTYYGDGSTIETDVAHHIRDVILQQKRSFSWQRGDLVLADNILTCHGREPYRGDRTVRVALYQKHMRTPFELVD